ncbi:PoNe immunity protein domain-containing protein [Pseudomonas viridiflava]|uniref:PoNe immunity protein domain-containing protein n=1 Tax=Pseudomonas viridiflava TaxID=33069 RepID=UPI002EAE8D7C|nr:PoNe immunity protein domain-containing protein [Pseudomonas viridiflava]
MNARQKFLSETRYANFLAYSKETKIFWESNKFESESAQQEELLRSSHFKDLALKKLLITYTAGVDIALLAPLLEELVIRYEERQRKLAICKGIKNISPLAIDDLLYQYEECVQVFSFCILLHRVDLLVRFVALLDGAGYKGEDTLYEDLLRKVLPGREDVDEWYHDIYSDLIHAVYADEQSEAAHLLAQYCKKWYPEFKQSPWHDSHLDGDEGSYVGYWAIEAGAIAFLYNIDDSKIDHMVYPKDLVEYARNYQGANGTQINRVAAGDPCTKTGYWFTPAQANSRRHFQQGEIMPSISDSTWGDTLWYWSGED